MSRKKKRVRCGFRKSNNSQIADFRWTGDGVVMRRRMCTARVGASRGTTGRSVWSTIDVAELRHTACACYGVSRSRGTDSFVYGNLDESSNLLAPRSDRFPPSAAVPPDGKPTPAQAASRSLSANLAGRGEALAVNPRMHVAFHSKRFVPTLVNMAQPGTAPMLLPPSHMGDRQPLHERCGSRIARRPNQKMSVVGHQCIGTDPHRRFVECFPQDVLKRLVIRGLLEQLHARLTPRFKAWKTMPPGATRAVLGIGPS